MSTIKIYGDEGSGNCYKIQLLCALLQIEHEWIHIDILNKETQTSDFLSKNPNGKIPLLELSDGRCLSESNAILNFLAHDSHLIPRDEFQKAQMLEWQFFEQYSHEPFIAVARFIKLYLGLPEDRRQEYESKQSGGHKALSVMETQLSKTAYLVGDHLTLADISLFAYTHIAHDGGFDLGQYPAIQQWIKRLSTTERFLAMKQHGKSL